MIPGRQGAPRLAIVANSPFFLRFVIRDLCAAVKRSGFEMLALTAAGEWAQEFQTMTGIEARVCDIERFPSPKRDILTLLQLVIAYRKFVPCIVHTFTPKGGLLGILAAW